MASEKVYEVITDQIIESLEKGVVPWHKPWKVSGSMPRNGKSGKAYRGINVILLSMSVHPSPIWLSFKQVVELGGKVKPGSKGTPVTFWKKLTVEDKDKPGKTRNIMMMRYYTVFNLDQTEGVKLPKSVAKLLETPAPMSPIETAEAISLFYEAERGPLTTEVAGNDRAYYNPAEDEIKLPPRGAFKTPEMFYATKFHEFGHSTGHKDRLGRTGVLQHNGFGSETYSAEELVAEMTSAFLSAEAGFDTTLTLENTKGYIGFWLSQLKADRKIIVSVASQAQKAVDYILDRKFGEEAAA